MKAKLYKEFAWLWWTFLAETLVVGNYGSANVFVNYPCPGNLNYRITTTHTATSTYPSPVTTSNTKYVVCQ